MTDTEKVFEQIKQIDAQIEALQVTRTLLRESLVPLIGGGGTDKVSYDYGDQRATWHPTSTTEKLDRSLLVRAGVTPEQLKAGTRVGTKKGYLDIRKIGVEEVA